MHDLALCLVWPTCCISPSLVPTTTKSDGHTCHVTACPAVAKRGPKKTGRKPGRPAVKKASTAPAKKGPGRPKGSGRSAKAGPQGRRGKHAAKSPTAAAQTAPAQAADPQKLNEARDSTADVQLEVVGTGVNSMCSPTASQVSAFALADASIAGALNARLLPLSGDHSLQADWPTLTVACTLHMLLFSMLSPLPWPCTALTARCTVTRAHKCLVPCSCAP